MDAQVQHRTDQDLGGAPEGLDALVVAERLKAGGVGLFVARDYGRSAAFIQAFRFFSQDVEVLEYPAWDCLPYDRLSPTAGVSAQRMATLTRLAQRQGSDKPLLVVTTVNAATQRTPPQRVTTAAGFETKVGRDLDTQALEGYFAANGYVQEAFVRQLAAEAGFVFVEASEINANPEDTKDHPFGVDTLAPTRLTAPRGEPADPAFDRSKYDAIGESDRMTLKFRKPE